MDQDFLELTVCKGKPLVVSLEDFLYSAIISHLAVSCGEDKIINRTFRETLEMGMNCQSIQIENTGKYDVKGISEHFIEKIEEYNQFCVKRGLLTLKSIIRIRKQFFEDFRSYVVSETIQSGKVDFGSKK